jgi:uncharacterized membrane protein YccC
MPGFLASLAGIPWRLWAWLGAAFGAALALAAAYGKGRQTEKAKRDADAAAAYRETRKDIDNADLGIGATDQQRIDRLREIADRRG